MAIKIGLDAGHGLKTKGKQTPDGIKEWTLNDKVRDKVVKYLADYDCEIIHTDNNEGATDESLASRHNKYVKAGVKAFVSIHHNAYTGKWNNATGVEVYTDKNPLASDTKLANCIYTRLVKNTGLKGRGVKQCDFAVINQDRIPAVLVEGGFMDGTKDYKYITSDAGQTAYAKAVAEGLIEFLGLKKKAVQTPVKNTTSGSFLHSRGYFKKGDRHENIGKIAAFMRRVFPSYTSEKALGNYYGDNLIKAVKEFQRRSGLKPDGYFGPLTLKALEKHGFKK
ncbi:MAG: N-acetylmuramoyl-L-alanine amidase [Clostridia bacterium]|nr:N-acetylmuramoyl-L-alanine amidase [Clostridia bacterium]